MVIAEVSHHTVTLLIYCAHPGSSGPSHLHEGFYYPIVHSACILQIIIVNNNTVGL